MEQKCAIEYIFSGIGTTSPKDFRKQALGFIVGAGILLLLVGFFFGQVFRWCQWLGIAGTAVTIILAITVVLLSFKTISVKKYLILQIILYAEIIWIFTLSSVMLYVVWFGIDWWLFFLLILPSILPIYMGIINRQKIKNGSYQKNKSGCSIPVMTVGGGIAGMIGTHIGKSLGTVSQDVAYLVVIFCHSIVVFFMSIGFLSIQKLYCVKTLEKCDPALKEVFAQNCYEIT